MPKLPVIAALDRALAQGSALRQRDHRPWELPSRPWFMAQTWDDLLFAHWAVDPDALERVMPPQLPPDTHGGRAWIGVTPFEVNAFRLRFTYPAPVISSFPEINVRTYVTLDGKPGIYFFSLDTSSRLGVESARRIFRLPYFHARQRKDGTSFSSERVHADGPEASFRGSYRPCGEPQVPAAGSLEHFLTERYCLYTLDERERVYRGDIHHRPWPLQPAEAEIELNTMAEQVGFALDDAPLLHYARRQDVVFWHLHRVSGS